MKLRRQLFLVSLLSLSLPWAGCQYIREMEDALREGQSIALLATAQAVSNRIASEPALRDELLQPSAQLFSELQIYSHPFASPIILDGYDDEWRHRNIKEQHWQQHSFQVRLQAAQRDNDVFLFVRVDDANILYYNPGLAHLTDSDHLLLRTEDAEGIRTDYIINTSAPGLINAYYEYHADEISEELAQEIFEARLNSTSDKITQRYLREHQIKGVWQERNGGYQIELQLPFTLTKGNLGIAIINKDSYRLKTLDESSLEDSHESSIVQGQWLGSITPTSAPKPLVKQNAVLNQALHVFAGNDLRLRVTGRNQWILATAGKLQSPNTLPAENDGLMTWILRHFLTQKKFPSLNSTELTGRLEALELERALDGELATQWYQYGVHNLGRAIVPVTSSERIIGAVVVEQTSASILSLTNNAFQRLFIYTLMATILAGAGLVAYASWLSFRIRRLSQAADTAIRADGKIDNQFPVSHTRDELGDLNRSYAQLLTRLQEYTEYLRTLSNKLSHELRTPLAVVRSSLDNLDQEALDPQAKIYAARAQEGSHRLSSILNAISSASRVEESISSTELAVFPLDEVVKELAKAYQDIASQKIICTIAQGKNYSLYGSADLIVQMIDKLFDNACDFCPPDKTILISLEREQESIILTLSNDGPLLPDKMQNQLFDSLVSIREKNIEQDNGTNKIHLGLGLHIVRLIVDYHQASVTAKNRSDGSGVEFKIIFNTLRI